MEYLIQKEERLFVPRFIPLIILFFCLLRSFGIEARIYTEKHFVNTQTPPHIIDTSRPFNERILWLHVNKRGFVDICSRPLVAASHGFYTPDIISSPARELTQGEMKTLSIAQGTLCFTPQKGDPIILCQKPDGSLELINNRPDQRIRPKRLDKESL